MATPPQKKVDGFVFPNLLSGFGHSPPCGGGDNKNGEKVTDAKSQPFPSRGVVIDWFSNLVNLLVSNKKVSLPAFGEKFSMLRFKECKNSEILKHSDFLLFIALYTPIIPKSKDCRSQTWKLMLFLLVSCFACLVARFLNVYPLSLVSVFRLSYSSTTQ